MATIAMVGPTMKALVGADVTGQLRGVPDGESLHAHPLIVSLARLPVGP